MIELLKRPEGATVEQIAAATGWQHHTSAAPSPARSRRSSGSRSRPPAPARSVPTRRRQGQRHRLPDRRLRRAPMIIERLTRPGYRLHSPDSPEAEPCSPSGASPGPTWTRPLPSWSVPRASDPDHRRHQRRRRVRQPPRRLAPGPARRRARALHPRALAPGPGAARSRARGQHGTVPRGRHPAGLIGPQLSAILRRPTVGIASRPLHGMFGVRRRDGDGFYARAGNGSRGRSPRPAALPRPLIGLRD